MTRSAQHEAVCGPVNIDAGAQYLHDHTPIFRGGLTRVKTREIVVGILRAARVKLPDEVERDEQ